MTYKVGNKVVCDISTGELVNGEVYKITKIRGERIELEGLDGDYLYLRFSFVPIKCDDCIKPCKLDVKYCELFEDE